MIVLRKGRPRLMLCKSCKNKYICRHFEYIKSIAANINIQVTECEYYSNNNQQIIHNPDKRPVDHCLYRQPLPSSIEEVEEIDENEEKVFINLDECDNAPKVTTIADMFLKGDTKND